MEWSPCVQIKIQKNLNFSNYLFRVGIDQDDIPLWFSEYIDVSEEFQCSATTSLNIETLLCDDQRFTIKNLTIDTTGVDVIGGYCENNNVSIFSMKLMVTLFLLCSGHLGHLNHSLL